MACYHPLKGFQVGFNPLSNKPAYRITSYNVDHIFFHHGKWHNVFKEQLDHFAPFENASNTVHDFVSIPCGQCIGCRLQRSRDWANRCMLELQYHDSAYFITLTYDDEHVPTVEHVDEETGLVSDLGTLVKKDFQDFMKRLRFNTGQELRYFACGEYGSHTARPHYHAIIFGLELDDLKLYKKSPLGDLYFNSATLNKTWKKGFCVVGDVTWQSCAYVARYITKKKLGKEALFYDEYGIAPEFTLMSRRPGIGREYLDEHGMEIYDSDFIDVCTPTGGKRFKPPKYFNRIMSELEGEFFENRKQLNKEISEVINDMKLETTSLNYLDMLQVEENSTIERTKSLAREL